MAETTPPPVARLRDAKTRLEQLRIGRRENPYPPLPGGVTRSDVLDARDEVRAAEEAVRQWLDTLDHASRRHWADVLELTKD